MKIPVLLFLFLCVAMGQGIGQTKHQMAPQCPSPMVENIRPHERMDQKQVEGKQVEITGVLPVPIQLFVPKAAIDADSLNLLIHFHGSHDVASYAAAQNNGWAIATINLGSGSSVYAQPFEDQGTFTSLIHELKSHLPQNVKGIYLSGWSAGYGAIRSIISTSTTDAVAGILLLDGMHAGYIPKGSPMAAGGQINEADLDAFLKWAKKSISGEKQFIFTHSAVFPGTFASTTECADHLIERLGMDRSPILQQGPVGMQQVGASSEGRFRILAFAGNSAPDHVDHLHGMFYFLSLFD